MNTKNFILSLLLILILPTTKIFSQWTLVNSGLPVSGGRAMDAVDDQLAVAVFSDGTYITEDGGNIWTELQLPESGNYVNDISMLDRNNIWYATGDGQIFGTIDGGLTWNEQFFDNTKTDFINYIEMFDLNNGVAMGDGVVDEMPIFLKTTDGGQTWISVNQTEMGEDSGDRWRRVDFVDMNTGYFYETGSIGTQKLHKTIDGGINWTETNHTLSINLLKFYNASIGLTVITSINRTLDGGETWEYFENPSAVTPNDIEFIPGNPAQVWFTTLDALYFSADTGRTWTTVLELLDTYGRDLVFTDAQHGWLLCSEGMVYKTDNNGGMVTGVEEENNLLTDFALYQNYPNPFNPTTTINFSIPVETKVELIIYDNIGREIETLLSELKPAGSYTINFNADNLSSGIYFVKMVSSAFSETKKMILLK